MCITSEEAVKKRAGLACWQQSVQSASAMCVLPVPTSPMSTRSSWASRKESDSSSSLPKPSGHDIWPHLCLIASKLRV